MPTSPNNEPVLQLADFTVSAGSIVLIEHFDLVLGSGRLVGLTGPSGCGKTTLLRAICGLIDPSSGSIRIQSTTPDSHDWPVFRRKIVLLQQKPILLDTTVLENLKRPFTYSHANGSTYPHQKALELIERFGLSESHLDQSAHSLSVGEQQRICLIRALLIEPLVLLMDEPTSALDEETALIIEHTIAELVHQRDLSVLLVSHNRLQVDRWCDERVDLSPYLSADALKRRNTNNNQEDAP